MADESVGIYVHVPFCQRVCPYCDFAVVGDPALSSEREARYVDALLAELEARAGAFEGRTLASLYLGGGTPSLLSPASVGRIIAAVAARFPRAPGGAGFRAPGEVAEITLEVNPSSVERQHLPGFREAGVGRLSIGVQSFAGLHATTRTTGNDGIQVTVAVEVSRLG